MEFEPRHGISVTCKQENSTRRNAHNYIMHARVDAQHYIEGAVHLTSLTIYTFSVPVQIESFSALGLSNGSVCTHCTIGVPISPSILSVFSVQYTCTCIYIVVESIPPWVCIYIHIHVHVHVHVQCLCTL